jgi:predicted nucleic acid-binding protein
MTDAGILDSNVLLRYILRDIPDQADQTRTLLRKIGVGEAEAVLLPTSFLEIVYVLERQYRLGRDRIGDTLYEILMLNGIRIVDREQLLDAAIEYRRRPGISFADAYHCAMARDFHSGSIISFDRKLNGIPGVTRRDPEEV